MVRSFNIWSHLKLCLYLRNGEKSKRNWPWHVVWASKCGKWRFSSIHTFNEKHHLPPCSCLTQLRKVWLMLCSAIDQSLTKVCRDQVQTNFFEENTMSAILQSLKLNISTKSKQQKSWRLRPEVGKIKNYVNNCRIFRLKIIWCMNVKIVKCRTIKDH